jgi:GNAT superfamily N-acetyltransferase
MGEQFQITTERSEMDIQLIHEYLSNHAYWAKGRDKASVIRSMENSICFGLFNRENQQLAFARIVTDYVVFAWLMDFFVVDAFRGKGLGKKLLAYIVEMPELNQVNGIGLRTNDAHGFYEAFGFTQLAQPETWMLRTKR